MQTIKLNLIVGIDRGTYNLARTGDTIKDTSKTLYELISNVFKRYNRTLTEIAEFKEHVFIRVEYENNNQSEMTYDEIIEELKYEIHHEFKIVEGQARVIDSSGITTLEFENGWKY